MPKCISMLRIRRGNELVDVPCGKCNFCLQNRRKEWSFRLQKELRYHTSAKFITLTYDDDNLPTMEYESKYGSFPRGILVKKDLQNFFKRLRKKQAKITDQKIKYYAVGEYGTKTCRPHYHAIVFGIDPRLYHRIQEAWSIYHQDDKDRSTGVYVPIGQVDVGSVTANSIDYVTKYVVNRYDYEPELPAPFSLISNGIGLQHLRTNESHYKTEDTVRNERGYKQVMPRYYRDKLNQNKITNDLRKQRYIEEAERRGREELDRLAKIHASPEAYQEERNVRAHDLITKHAKKGTKL